MSAQFFKCQEHEIPGQHIRHRLRATATSQEEQLLVTVKQYTPLNTTPQDGDMTIIAAHANGFPKELYEPLWDDLYQQSLAGSFRIRSIWFADMANQGASGVRNESKLGNDPSWFDHARDLLQVVNHFRDQMTRPILGVGHSMGGTALIHLSLIHPRLFSGLVLIDPTIRPRSNAGGESFLPAFFATIRKDTWPSRAEAEKHFRKSPMHRTWDERVLNLYLKHGLREDLSSQSQSSTQSGADLKQPRATLTTSKHQEAFNVARPAYPPKLGQPLHEFRPTRQTHPDLDAEPRSIYFKQEPFYFAEGTQLYTDIGRLRPPVLYLRPTTWMVMNPNDQAELLAAIGIGRGGSGGLENKAVKDVVVQDSDHFIPFCKPTAVADAIAAWMPTQVKRHQAEQAEWEEWAKVPDKQKRVVNDKWMYWMQQLYGRGGGGVGGGGGGSKDKDKKQRQKQKPAKI